jgi:hypothetical protein
MLGASQTYKLIQRRSMMTVKVKISRYNRPRRARAVAAWRWPSTPSSAKVEERVEPFLHSPSVSLSVTEPIRCSHHIESFPPSTRGIYTWSLVPRWFGPDLHRSQPVTTITEVFPCLSSVVRHMPGYKMQRRGTARTSQINFKFFYCYGCS